ncbi:MAG: hypothetical protein ACRDJW_03555 [Thermomicrobiales bacterium]
MVAPVEERIALLEARVSDIEETLARRHPPRIGVTIEEVRAKVGRPAERGPEQFERLHRIFGRFSGPEDLSSRMRDYLYGERE